MLFSIPVHENHDIINNQIENIFKFNPLSTIILHVNISFTDFDKSKINKNVYINSKRFPYRPGNGMLWIHLQNYLEAIELNIPFHYFVILASNEMFIRKGMHEYVEKHKNGIQLVEYDSKIDWHLFHRDIHLNPNMIKIMNKLNVTTFYGGQSEGNFFEKGVFQQIVDVYFDSDIVLDDYSDTFETDEVMLQTIFYGLNIKKYTIPITLQNYCNAIQYTSDFIDDLLNKKIIIENKRYPKTLLSPHTGKDIDTIFSIKRVDRTFNPLRLYITNLY